MVNFHHSTSAADTNGHLAAIRNATIMCLFLFLSAECQALQIRAPAAGTIHNRSSPPSSFALNAIENRSIEDIDGPTQRKVIFENVVNSRYACTRFHRHDETTSISESDPNQPPTASESNPDVVSAARSCLEIARRSPSGFNVQPYKLLMVHSKAKKEALAKYCIGRNADRVRDSDCTIIFLADRECLREYKRFGRFLDGGDSGSLSRSRNKSPDLKSKKWAKRKIQGLILLFSSGWPLPRVIANPLSFSVRVGVSAVSVLTRRKVLVPSLGSADTWASKNTMLVAMTYMLACTSSGLDTCPMEGFNAGGVRKAMGIPKRYSIPLIVSTGVPFKREEEGKDDVGMEHGTSPKGISLTRRYPNHEVIYENVMSE